jgi:hypothetical protein
VGSGAMIYMPSFIKIDSTIQECMRGDTQTYGEHGDPINVLLFLRNEELRLKSLNLQSPMLQTALYNNKNP